jgi:hypothetical protein
VAKVILLTTPRISNSFVKKKKNSFFPNPSRAQASPSSLVSMRSLLLHLPPLSLSLSPQKIIKRFSLFLSQILGRHINPLFLTIHQHTLLKNYNIEILCIPLFE